MMSEDVHKNHRARMRKRFIEHGAANLADHELLELLLYYAVPRGDVNPLAHTLINEFGTFAGVLDAQVGDLLHVKGVGESAATLLNMIPVIFQRYKLSHIRDRKKVRYDTTEKIGEFLVSYYVGKTNELAAMMLLDNSCRLIRMVEIGEGGPSSVRLDTRKMIQSILQCNAANVILAHNHPRGELHASREDILETTALRDVMRRIDVNLLDHFIVTENRWMSMASRRVFLK